MALHRLAEPLLEAAAQVVKVVAVILVKAWMTVVVASVFRLVLASAVAKKFVEA